MRFLISLAFLFYSLPVIYCQDLKLVTRTTYTTTEKYEVLKSDKRIKNGSYTKEIYEKVSAKGNYKNNERVGIWEFYNFQSNELEQKYDYDNKKLLFGDIQQKPYNFYYNGKWTIAKLDSFPYLIGGLSDLKLQLFEKIWDYCYQYGQPTIPYAGVTVFSFVVDKDGTTKNHKISISSKNSIEESLLKIIKDYSNIKWIPGIYNGEKVETEYIISMYMSYEIKFGTVEKLYFSFDQPIKK
jgi:hypothetical protein